MVVVMAVAVMLLVVVIIVIVVIVIIVMMMMLMLVLIVVIIMVVMVMMLVLVLIVVIIVIVIMILDVGVLDRLDPACGLHGALKVETARVEDVRDLDLRVVGLDDDRLGLEALDDCLELAELVLIDRVDFVQENRVAELELLDEQVLDVLLLVGVLEEASAVLKLVVHAGAVDDRDDVVEHHRKAVLRALLADIRDRLGDRDRLADAGSLDDDVVKFAGLRKVAKLGGQIVAERAADAAVGQRDQVAVLLCDDAALGDQLGVNVDLADVIDDNRRADPFVVA